MKSTTHRVSTKQSPHLKVFYNHHAVHLTLDTGAETSMIKTSVAKQIGANIKKTKQTALQADGITPLSVIGEVHLNMSRNGHTLHLDALVVNDLDVDVLAGTPFMASNDVSIRPSKQQITIQGTDVTYYNAACSDSKENRIRRTQAHVLRAPPTSSVIWPGEYLEISIPSTIDPDTTLAIEPRPDYSKSVRDWPHPHILEAVAGRVRIVNDTKEPQNISRHEHFCQVRLTHTPDEKQPQVPLTPHHNMQCTTPAQIPTHSSKVSVDPDNILPDTVRRSFHDLLAAHDQVFDPTITGYNGAVGPFEAVVNMGPVQPPQRKG